MFSSRTLLRVDAVGPELRERLGLELLELLLERLAAAVSVYSAEAIAYDVATYS